MGLRPRRDSCPTIFHSLQVACHLKVTCHLQVAYDNQLAH